MQRGGQGIYGSVDIVQEYISKNVHISANNQCKEGGRVYMGVWPKAEYSYGRAALVSLTRLFATKGTSCTCVYLFFRYNLLNQFNILEKHIISLLHEIKQKLALNYHTQGHLHKSWDFFCLDLKQCTGQSIYHWNTPQTFASTQNIRAVADESSQGKSKYVKFIITPTCETDHTIHIFFSMVITDCS